MAWTSWIQPLARTCASPPAALAHAGVHCGRGDLLADGVGTTAAIFSVVDGVLLRPLSAPDPGQLVLVGERVPEMQQASRKFRFFDTPSAYLAWRERATDFQALAALQNTSFTLTGEGEPRVLDGARVTTDFFRVLGVTPELGRFFTTDDADATLRPVVISDACGARRSTRTLA